MKNERNNTLVWLREIRDGMYEEWVSDPVAYEKKLKELAAAHEEKRKKQAS